MVRLLPPSAGRRVQLERPQEVAGVFEVLADGHDLVDEVLDADDAVSAEFRLDEVVGSDRRPLAVELDEAAFVDQLADRLEVRRSPRDIRLCNDRNCCLIGVSIDRLRKRFQRRKSEFSFPRLERDPMRYG